MSSTKRGNDTNGSAERPNKIRRLDGETARPTTSPNPHESSDLLEKIAVLEKGRHDQAHQIKQLQKDLEGANQRVECAENKRTALIEHLQDPDGQMPNYVREQIDTHPAAIFAARIRKQADETYNELHAQLQCEKCPEDCTNSYSIRACDANAKLLPQIETLSQMDGGAELALDITLYLGRRTYMGVKKHWVPARSISLCQGRGVFDAKADTLLLRFAHKMKIDHRDAVLQKALNELTLQRRVFLTTSRIDDEDPYDLGLYTYDDIHGSSLDACDRYFPRSYVFIWSCVVRQAGVAAHVKELETSIRRDYVEVTRSATSFTIASIALSHAMSRYIAAISRMKSILQGPKITLDLAIFLSSKTIPPIELPTGNLDNCRHLDDTIDRVVLELLKRLKSTPSFLVTMSSIARKLEANRRTLEDRDINQYLPMSRALLADCLSKTFDPEQL